MKRIIIIGISLLLLLSGSAQELRLLVLDSVSLEPLRDAHIGVKGTTAGTITDAGGRATLPAQHATRTLLVSHIGYKPASVHNASPDRQNRILLSPHSYPLPSLEVRSPAPVSITANKPWFVKDYIPLDSSILVLTYVNQRFSRSHVALIRPNGDFLGSTPLPYATGLYTDPLGNNFVFTESTIWQIYIEENQIFLMYPASRDAFFRTMGTLMETSLPYYYLRFYSYGRHRAHFWVYNDADSNYLEFHQVADGAGMNMYDDMPRMLDNASDAQIRFEREIMHKPLHAPLFLNGDTVFIINPVDMALESFSKEGTPLFSIRQELSADKTWKGMLLKPENDNLFTLHIKNGITTLYERNPSDLSVIRKLSLPGFPFIENIKIGNDKIFFLYKNYKEQEFKQLYCMRL